MRGKINSAPSPLSSPVKGEEVWKIHLSRFVTTNSQESKATSHVEEHRLPLALEPNIEMIDELPVLVFAIGDQRGAARFVLD